MFRERWGSRQGFPFCLCRVASRGRTQGVARNGRAQGGVAERLCSGLQIRLGRFDSDPRLHRSIQNSCLRDHRFTHPCAFSRRGYRSNLRPPRCPVRRMHRDFASLATVIAQCTNKQQTPSSNWRMTVRPSGGIGRHKGLENLSPRGETSEVTPVKVGEGPDRIPHAVELTPNQARRITSAGRRREQTAGT